MDEGKFAAEFLAKNLEKIIALGVQVFGKADEAVQISLKTAYTEYLKKVHEKYSKSKSFFIRHEPVDLYSYYVPTGIRCGKAKLNKPTFQNLTEISKRVVITGSGGSGKSVLIKHLFLNCIEHKEYAPILIELRDLNSEGKNLEDVVMQTLDTFGFKVSGDYVKRAKIAGHFCYFLDGFDEVSPTQKARLIREITQLSKRFPLCPIILSSRPDDVFNGIEDFSVFSIEPLELASAIELVEKLPFDDAIKKKFTSDLSSGLFEQHKSFLSNPLLLSIMLLTYGEHAEIPSKLSIFYNQAYEALFQRHDAYKGGFSRGRKTSLDIQDFAKVFSLFALQTYEKRLFKMPRTTCLEFIEKSSAALKFDFKSEDYLSDLISAACLLVEDGLEIAFSHRSFQEYFVARHISQSMPDVQVKLIDRYWKNMRQDNVIELLLEINPELVERQLLIPQLEKLFEEIGVKRKVGITHTVEYFKKVYSSLDIEDGGIHAMFRSRSADASAIVRMAVSHCATYEKPERAHFQKFRDEIEKKYGDPEKAVHYPAKTLTSRSQIMIDVTTGKGVFSTTYLDAGYRAFKQLKQNHSNTMQSLDALLGIKT